MTWDLTSEVAESILSQLEDGISLRNICRQDGMPSRRTVLRWQRDNKDDFGTKCAHAREAAGEMAADELDDINALVLTGELKPDAANVISSNKKWKASKLASKTYGDSTTLKGDAENPLSMILADRLDKITRKDENA